MAYRGRLTEIKRRAQSADPHPPLWVCMGRFQVSGCKTTFNPSGGGGQGSGRGHRRRHIPLRAVMVPNTQRASPLDCASPRRGMDPGAAVDRVIAGLRLAETGHGLSRSLMNLVTFGREAHGEPPAASCFSLSTKMPGSRALFKSQASFRENLPMQAHKGGKAWDGGSRGRKPTSPGREHANLLMGYDRARAVPDPRLRGNDGG